MDLTSPPAATLVASAAQALKARVEEVNRLNVFPVPDGDTGTNMSLTMDAVTDELGRLPAHASNADICKAITHASLMGARGNSGVILSQVLRGLCDVLGSTPSIDAEQAAAAIDRARRVAYQAVRKPVEGTMLTVVADAAGAAQGALSSGVTLGPLLARVVEASFESVRRGPDLLPVLKENGVVDAGGFGLAILAEGFVAALEGHDVRLADTIETSTGELAVVPADDWDDQEYLYCTEFLLFGDALDRSTVEAWVIELGGSELVVGGPSELKIHVHTDNPAAVIARATQDGEVADVHINNMRRQTAARTAALREGGGGAPVKAAGFVAVAAGDGLAEILASLGVDRTVSGGQTMNPSTAELLDAVQAVNAESVFILPNNRNIILAAQQVPAVAGKNVYVVPTTSVPQAFAALLAFDPDADIESALADMSRAAASVVTGEITTAIKDAKGKAGRVREGQLIGVMDKEIEVVGDDLADVALRLASIVTDKKDTLMLLAGAELDDVALQAIEQAIGAALPDVEIESHRGGQPLYPLIMSAE